MIQFALKGIALIPKDFHRAGLVLMVLLVVGSLLDFFSIASFIPILIVLTGSVTQPSQTLSEIFRQLGIITPAQIILSLATFAVVLVFIKTAVVNAISQRKARYAYRISDVLAEMLVAKHLSRPFSDFTQLDHARELNRISNLPLIFANNFVIPIGTVLSESIIALSLLTMVAWYDVRLFLFQLVILLPMVVWLSIQKRHAENSSREIKTVYPRLLKVTMQAIEGFAEIRSFGRESFFKSKFIDAYSSTSETMAKDHSFHQKIARASELMAACAIGALMAFSVWHNDSVNTLALTLGLYAAVSFRIIPSVNRIASSIMQIRSHGYAVTEIETDVGTAHELPRIDFLVLERISLHNIHYSYGANAILTGLDLSIQRGERVVISGKSGSGKTTLLHILLNFIKPSRGSIIIDKHELSATELAQFRIHADYVSQNPYILDGSIVENIAFGEASEHADIAMVNSILSELGLLAWAESLPNGIQTTIGEKGTRISGGQRQRIAIGRALYAKSEILLLDEVTNQLDRESEAEIIRLFERPSFLGKTIIVVSHHPDVWRNSGTVYILEQGKLVKSEKNLQAAF